MEELDETMSQDEAFSFNDDRNKSFVFDEEGKPSDSQPETDEHDEHPAPEGEDEEGVSEGQRVPYSRFKKMKDAADAAQQREEASKAALQAMEERLRVLESRKSESPTDIELPPEWAELYGENEVAKRAYALQLKRERDLEERLTRQAAEKFRAEQKFEEERVQQNEEIISDNIAELQEAVGVKLTEKQQEELLAIVDEFSPVGEDGKYLSLFPFDKAYEIYTYRKQGSQRKVHKERTDVARIINGNSEGETDASDSDFTRGWDGWRNQL